MSITPGHAVALRFHLLLAVGLLHLIECQRHAIHKYHDIRAELFTLIGAVYLSRYVEAVAVKILEVYQTLSRSLSHQFFVELSPQVIIIQHRHKYRVDIPLSICLGLALIQPYIRTRELVSQDIGLRLSLFLPRCTGKKLIAQSHQL